MIGLHHIYTRKRQKSFIAKLKHHKKYDRLDRIITLAGVGSVFAGLTQVIEIYSSKDATAVSSFLFGYYMCFCVLMLYYGSVHKYTPILLTYTGNTVINALIFIGTFIY